MKFTWKKALGIATAASMLMGTAACSNGDTASEGSTGDVQDVTLTVWAPQEDQAEGTNWLAKVEEGFEKEHPEYNITWKNDVVSEGDASKTVTTDPTAAADVYMFASDQLGVLIDSGAIGQLGTDAEKQVREQNGDMEIDSVTGTDGKLYGVPYTDNTWFMYYNKAKISDEDAKNLDTMLSKAVVTFPLSNSWYINGFYDGLELFGPDGTDEDAGIVFPADGADITSYLVDLVANPNFRNDDGASGLADLQAGTADVLFSGTWSAADVKAALGDNMGVAALPTFTVDGQTKQMKSFAATKAVAYNPNAENTRAAAEFAAYMGSTDAQKWHYEMRQIPPTDQSLSDLISDDPAAKAQADTMANTAILQSGLSAMNGWWTPAETFGKALVNKEVTADNAAAKFQEWVDQLGAKLA